MFEWKKINPKYTLSFHQKSKYTSANTFLFFYLLLAAFFYSQILQVTHHFNMANKTKPTNFSPKYSNLSVVKDWIWLRKVSAITVSHWLATKFPFILLQLTQISPAILLQTVEDSDPTLLIIQSINFPFHHLKISFHLSDLPFNHLNMNLHPCHLGISHLNMNSRHINYKSINLCAFNEGVMVCCLKTKTVHPNLVETRTKLVNSFGRNEMSLLVVDFISPIWLSFWSILKWMR